MASAAGSVWFTVTAFLIIGLAVLLLIRHYFPLRSSPAYLTIPIFLASALPISAILLVPIDLSSSVRTEDVSAKGIWLPERAVLVLWRIIYWLTFVLTWLVLPVLGEYMDSGYRDFKSRMVYSLHSNGRYQLIMVGSGVAGLIYMILSYGFDFTAIKGLVMALAYVWGLMLAIYLMGHGLVAVPRSLIRKANVAGQLRLTQSRAPRVHERLEDAIISLEDLEGQISQLKQRKTGVAQEFADWIDDLADMVATVPPRLTLATPGLDIRSKVPAVITERYLADLTRRFERARHQRARYVEEWDRIVGHAADLQAVLDAQSTKQLVFSNKPRSSLLPPTLTLTPTMRFYLHAYILTSMRLVLGVLLACASVAVVWSELIRFPLPQLSAVSLTVIHHPQMQDYRVGFGGQVIAAFWICYMCTCALSSVTDVPVWNQRALVQRNTYPESACWYAGLIARLTVPLAYNFLTFLPQHIQEQTTFHQFLGKLINLTPLGTWFDYLFPIFILLPVCATLFNLYGKVKRTLGFGVFEDDDEESNPSGFGTGGWREGRDLIARDLNGAGGGGSSVGLLSARSSPRGSNDLNRGTRWSTPAPPAATNGSVNGLRHSRPQGRVVEEAVTVAEPAEENFLSHLGRRVRNTIDTFETPRWLQTSGGSTASRPRWMGGDGGESTSFFDRLFNSRTQDTNSGPNSRRIVL